MEGDMSSARTSLWLLPAATSGLDAAIAGIAQRHGRTPFPAHLTLATGAWTPSEADIAALAAATPALTLTRDGVLRTQTFSRSYALCFELTEALIAAEMTARDLVVAQSHDFLPHVSLVYGPIPNLAVLDAVSAACEAPLLFDRLACVGSGPYFETQDDVAAIVVQRVFPLGR